MKDRIGKYVCLVMDGKKIDLYRDEHKNLTPNFKTVEEAKEAMKTAGVVKYTICKIEEDTF